MKNILKKRRSLLWILVAVITILIGTPDMSDARSSGGGRSFGGSGGSFGRGSSRSSGSPSMSPSMQPSRSPSSGFFNTSPGSGSGSFWKGVGGGLVGGFIGNMLFSRSGYSGGHGGGYSHYGGGGGGGIGLFDLLLLGGLGYFLYRWFIKPRLGSRNTSSPLNPFSTANAPSAGASGPPPTPPPMNASGDDYYFLRQSEPDFDPEKFKEIAQDVFFKVQAAWMRRDTVSVQGLIGQQLKSEYDVKFAELKQKGLINRLENIAVRHIEIVDAGQEGQEVYIKVLFTANLLDYMVEEASGNVVKGDPSQPVKFEEYWTFARPVASTLWKLEGIQEK